MFEEELEEEKSDTERGLKKRRRKDYDVRRSLERKEGAIGKY